MQIFFNVVAALGLINLIPCAGPNDRELTPSNFVVASKNLSSHRPTNEETPLGATLPPIKFIFNSDHHIDPDTRTLAQVGQIIKRKVHREIQAGLSISGKYGLCCQGSSKLRTSVIPNNIVDFTDHNRAASSVHIPSNRFSGVSQCNIGCDRAGVTIEPIVGFDLHIKINPSALSGGSQFILLDHRFGGISRVLQGLASGRQGAAYIPKGPESEQRSDRAYYEHSKRPERHIPLGVQILFGLVSLASGALLFHKAFREQGAFTSLANSSLVPLSFLLIVGGALAVALGIAAP